MQELLGHADVATTMFYSHVLKVGGGGVCSPADTLPEFALGLHKGGAKPVAPPHTSRRPPAGNRGIRRPNVSGRHQGNEAQDDADYKRGLALVRAGGLVALDNMLWSGAAPRRVPLSPLSE